MKSTPCTEPFTTYEHKFSFNLSPRCGAKTRKGTSCKSPAIRNKKRCRMHGGKGSGAPKKNKNAIKHGVCTSEIIALRKEAREGMRRWRELKKSLDYLKF